MANIEELKRISSQVRRDIVRMVSAAQSGHPGGSLSSADVLTALYFNVMNIDPANWTRESKGQDIFILSAGHITPVYYSLLSRRGFFPVEELATFRKFGTRLQGHPSVEKGLPGITQASGSLGQGLSAAAGAALGKKMDGDASRVYVLCGDGESEEGQIWEAAMFASHHKLDNLIAITDWNGQQIDGTVDAVSGQGDLESKWKAFGWNVIVADGHDFEAILAAFDKAKESRELPTMILFKTDMGHGIDFMSGTCKWHGKAPSAEQCEQALAQIEETLGDY
ncbi:MAG: transketolase [Candidatus Cryptobacteroides sp.]